MIKIVHFKLYILKVVTLQIFGRYKISCFLSVVSLGLSNMSCEFMISIKKTHENFFQTDKLSRIKISGSIQIDHRSLFYLILIL